MKRHNLIVTLTIDFSLKIIDLYRKLVAEKDFVISKQLLKSGTSIGANVHESIAAESARDFIHKMSISLKEAHETEYWLILLDESQFIEIDLKEYKRRIDQIISVLTSIIKTMKSKHHNNP